MLEKLRELKIKITPQRIELIEVLNEIGGRHPSFTEISRALNSKYPNISKSTIHNNLKTMVKRGLLQSFNYNGETRYETDLEPHINLLKPNGTIKDIKDKDIITYVKEIKKLINEKEKIHIKHISILVE